MFSVQCFRFQHLARPVFGSALRGLRALPALCSMLRASSQMTPHLAAVHHEDGASDERSGVGCEE